MKFNEPLVYSGGFVFYKSFLKKRLKIFAIIKIKYIFTSNFKTNMMKNTNKITKENLKQLGDILRNNKEIKTLDVISEGRKSFQDNKKEFCIEVLNLLESGKLLQISLITEKGYLGTNRVSIKDYINSNIIKEIEVSVYEIAKGKTNPSNWSLD